MVGQWRDEGGRYLGVGTLLRLLVQRRPQPEATQVTLRHAYLPQRFRWRGGLYGIRSVERVWERARPQPQRLFEVCCQDGQQATLIHDLQANVWYVCRADLAAG